MQIEKDGLTKTARKNWSEGAAGKAPFKAPLVAGIYRDELRGSKTQPPKLRRIMLLEISQYLENYLIPNCTEVCSLALLSECGGWGCTCRLQDDSALHVACRGKHACRMQL